MTAVLVALHLGGIPELAMFLGPILLIAAFVRIARRKESSPEDDDWDADVGDLTECGDGGHDVQRPKNPAL